MSNMFTKEVCALSLDYFKGQLRILFTLGVFIVAVYSSGFLLFITILGGYKGGILPLVFLLGGAIVLQLGLIKVTLNITGNKPVTVRDAFKNYNMSLRYLVGFFAYFVIVFLGLCLFIVPGIVWAVRYSMWPFLLVHRDLEVLEAFKESSKITYGSKKDLGMLYVTLLGGVVVSLIPFGLGILVFYPYMLLVLAQAYRKMQLLRTNEVLYANMALKIQ